MGRTKSTYLINFGIAPYLQKVFIRDVAQNTFAFSFDETGTIQGKQQYDCYIRYNSNVLKKVVTRYESLEFLGHCTAEDLFHIFFLNSKIFI